MSENVFTANWVDLKKSIDTHQLKHCCQIDDNTFTIYQNDKMVVMTQSEPFGVIHMSDFDKSDFEYWRRFILDGSCYAISLVRRMQFHGNSLLDDVAEYCSGIVLFRQDPWECFITLIMTSHIKEQQQSNKLAEFCMDYGHKVGDFYSFPTPEEIVSKYEQLPVAKQNRGRLKYVYRVAKSIANGEFSFKGLNNCISSYAVAYNELTDLFGVSSTIAENTCLRSLGHGNAFPYTTYVKEMLEKPEMSEFSFRVFGSDAGLLSLYLDYYGKKHHADKNYIEGEKANA